jgi:UDP-N-acetylmuramate-alanine ligase
MAQRLAQLAEPGDVVIALGAGDINKLLELVRKEIEEKSP